MLDSVAMEWLISRIAHDLASPLGAVGNGLELWREERDAGMREQALALSERSNHRASAILMFFRMAYGRAGASVDFAFPTALGVAQDWLKGGRLSITGTADGEVSGPACRLFLKMVLVACEIMPRGGELIAKLRPRNLELELKGGRGGALEEARRILSGDAVALGARTAPVLFAREDALLLGLRLTLAEQSEQNAVLAAT
ncbi:MAG TPA: histidine phosphotransferase family protein [Dongiaceae bacterium]|jgi:histidine phosphotransferase ChpT|nr:histidine phosphotransferase family protein [Dongiaceae bacterium]